MIVITLLVKRVLVLSKHKFYMRVVQWSQDSWVMYDPLDTFLTFTLSFFMHTLSKQLKQYVFCKRIVKKITLKLY